MKLAKVGPDSTGFWSMSNRFGPALAKFGPTPTGFGQAWPHSAEFGPTLTRSGPTFAKLVPGSAIVWQTSTSAECPPPDGGERYLLRDAH